MPHIQVLDQVTIDKIAAGEVIERPASIVKELVENAVDAGADSVTVEIRDGGIDFIRVTDNGCGIPHDEVRSAFLRHSTSKIRSVEDLMHIRSLGFRGEALSSIAAVTRTELITKTEDCEFGTRYVIEGGKEVSIEETGAPNGTTFLVHQLFYNVPARRKFLKTPMTEAGHVQDLLMHLALSHPEVAFLRDAQPEWLEEVIGVISQEDYIRAKYAIDEVHRLLDACAALAAGDYETVGRKMYGTHIGMSVLYEVSCEELDFLNEVAKECGVTGSRVMGGGFGGCTINVVPAPKYDEFINTAKAKYKERFGIDCKVYPVVISDGARRIA